METKPYRVVHISDLHFWRIPLQPWHWYGKRLLGLTNLVLRRARKFRREAVPLLLQEIELDQPDHLIVSGDLTTTALHGEFEDFGAAFISWLDRTERLTVIPGNHDRYNRHVHRGKRFEQYYAPLMGEGTFPFLKDLTPGLVLIAFDPCHPNPISARGSVRDCDLKALLPLLDKAKQGGAKSVLFVCHYPAEMPAPHQARAKGHELRRGNLLLDALKQVEVPIYWLHGHVHQPWRYTSPTLPNVTYLNPGAPTLRRKEGFSLGRWVLDWDGEEMKTEWKSLPAAANWLKET